MRGRCGSRWSCAPAGRPGYRGETVEAVANALLAQLRDKLHLAKFKTNEIHWEVDPIRKVGRPAPRRPRALTPIEIEAIRSHLPRQSDKVAWGLMAYAGLRPAEAHAARWSDISGPILVVDAMKTLRRRAVEIVPPLMDDMEALRAEGIDANGWIATSPQGGPVDQHNWRERVFRPACRAAGVTATPYNGRTSYCSLLIHEGRSLAYVAAAMGNSARVISDHYLHFLRAAELGDRKDMTQAIYEARNVASDEPDVRRMFGAPVRGQLRMVS